mmetsp:Transcript_39850/g.81351  ORF Transcript_39850/g.81351 Transcript_39850/m.81351 type:complete len:80 (-) Transcript_39850:431-670(-)
MLLPFLSSAGINGNVRNDTFHQRNLSSAVALAHPKYPNRHVGIFEKMAIARHALHKTPHNHPHAVDEVAPHPRIPAYQD